MLSKLILALITVCILCGLITSTAQGATPEQHLAKAKDAWVEAAGDKVPTLAEADAVIRTLRLVLAAPAQLKFVDEKAARRLLVEVYQAKYSLLESPEWTNTKGGARIPKNGKIGVGTHSQESA